MKYIFLFISNVNSHFKEDLVKQGHQWSLHNAIKNLANLYGDEFEAVSFADDAASVAIEINAAFDLANSRELKMATEVIGQIVKKYGEKIILVLFGEPQQLETLIQVCLQRDIKCVAPFKYLEKGSWSNWIDSLIQGAKEKAFVDEIYDEAFRLASVEKQYQIFGNYSGATKLPKRGLYLYIDDNEPRIFDRHRRPRIVRIGTHAVSENSKSNLWQRLKAHLGKEDGDGNHRSSIFRLHVGTAILALNKAVNPTWATGKQIDPRMREAEVEIEKSVSRYISSLRILWIDINDLPSKFSDRAYIEQNLIASLSAYNNRFDFATEGWLGHFCTNKVVRRSFLWNVNHCTEGLDTTFIKTLRLLISNTIAELSDPNSIAPKNWYDKARSGYKQDAINFE